MTHVQRILDATPATDLADHLRRGGGNGLDVARHTTPMSLISLVEQSGLRGRGGAGFPTGKKWRTVIAAASGSPIPVIVNAAEGEPGTFKDRSLLRSNPYLVLEGACIAAHATGAHEVIVAIKASFIQEIKRLQFAIDEIAVAGWTPANGVRIVEGPDEYLFGEETALLEVIDGRPPFPRVTPPYRRGIHDNESDPGLSWDDGPAALVDNVETIANIPGIVRHGVDWYRSVGTASSPGTILCTVTGDTLRHGVGEFTMGTPLREVIDSIGGGVRTDRTIAAVLSGVSNPALGPGQLDTPVTYEHMAAVGSGLGSASFIVIDDQTSLAAVAAGTARFLAVESCGQCEPCKRDGLAIADSLRTKDAGLAEVWNRLGTVARGARCALAGQTERIVGRLLELAGTESTRDHNTPYPIVPLVDIVDGQARPDLTYASKRPDWTFAGESRDSGLWPVQRGADRQSKPRPAYHPVAQPASNGHVTPGALTTHDPFAALHRLHRDLEISVANVRRVPAAERAAALASLRAELDRHRHGTEALIYPLVARLAPDIGDDIAWYPAHHEAHAARILDRLDIGDPISPRLVDELCADIHVSILELDYRVLPVLQSALDEDLLEELRIAADIDELMGTP